MKTRNVLAWMISLPLFSGLAMADAKLEFKVGSEGEKIELLIQDGKLMIPDAGDGNGLLFVRDEAGIIFLDNQYREFTAVNEEWIRDYAEKMAEVAKGVEERLKEQMKDMPPEQKKLYQQGQMGMKLMPMLGGFMGSGGGGLGGLVSGLLGGYKGPKSYIPTSQKFTVAGIVCSQVDVFQSGSKVENLCVAKPADLGLTAGEAKTIEEFNRVASSMTKSGIGMMGFDAPGLSQIGIQGVPLWVKKTGAEDTDLQLISASAEAIDPDEFMIPENYMETQIPVLGQ